MQFELEKYILETDVDARRCKTKKGFVAAYEESFYGK